MYVLGSIFSEVAAPPLTLDTVTQQIQDKSKWEKEIEIGLQVSAEIRGKEDELIEKQRAVEQKVKDSEETVAKVKSDMEEVIARANAEKEAAIAKAEDEIAKAKENIAKSKDDHEECVKNSKSEQEKLEQDHIQDVNDIRNQGNYRSAKEINDLTKKVNSITSFMDAMRMNVTNQ